MQYAGLWFMLTHWMLKFVFFGAFVASQVVDAGVAGIDNVIREVDQELCQATLSRRIVPEYGRKGGVSEGFGETLAQSLSRAGIVAQPG